MTDEALVERVAMALYTTEHWNRPSDCSFTHETDSVKNYWYRCARAAIAAMPQREWRPISEAPKDGTTVLVYAPERGDVAGEPLPPIICTCAWHEDAGWCVDELRYVTHFMFLPSPPP